MSHTVSASEVEMDFIRYHDRALSEPVRVVMDGRETVYIVSAHAYHGMRRAQRETLASAELTDNELALIETAEIPVEHRYATED